MTLLLLLLPLGALGQDRDWQLELVPDPGQAPPYAGEMILATLRGHYHANVAREELETPQIPDFAWLQLGFDNWEDRRVDGVMFRIFERRLALFPARAGALTIPGFTHHLTLGDRDGKRFPRDVTSAPVTLDIAAPPALAPGWWLPARSVQVTDTWTGTPSALPLGEGAERVVTLTVHGVPAELLPPAPDLATPGLFVFLGPEERSVTLTKDGPVAQVTWRWSILPDQPQPVVMKPVILPWFDTTARAGREAVLEGQTIAVSGRALGAEIRDAGTESLGRRAGPAGLGLGLVLGLVVILPGLSRLRRPRLRLPARLRLRLARLHLARAVAQGNAARLHALACQLLPDPTDPARRALDAALFSRTASPEATRAAGRAILSRLRHGPDGGAARQDRGITRQA